MGQAVFDRYSVLHLASGLALGWLGLPFWPAFMGHAAFEVLENTDRGMGFINAYFRDVWPGGKDEADAVANSIGDQIAFTTGWLLTYRDV